MYDLDEQPASAATPGNKRNVSLKIFALGRFSVVRDSEPIRFARKAQRRPLQLLKVLIALGGREIAMARLAATLWPDAEGDAAHKAFEIALHRLRRFIGVDKALVLHDGQLGLDNQYCWVDVWEFEQAASRTEALLKSTNKDADELALLCANVMALYHGHFLGREPPEPWSISLRERLRSKFLRHLIDMARFWEQTGRREAAILCYQKGLEIDDLAEIFYQRLMICYQHQGRRGEALAVYRRCRATLSLILGISPAPATEAIRKSLLDL